MHEVIYAHGGIVDKHLGDGLMAVFGLSGEGSGAGASMRALQQLVQATSNVLAGLPPRSIPESFLWIGRGEGSGWNVRF